MDSFEINKIVAVVLIVALVFIGLANFGEILYEVEKPEVAHYQVEGTESVMTISSEAVAEETPIIEEVSIIELLASADIDKGAKVFNS